ncbi:MAG: DNA starvation/stationary phase protection protein [Saprospiraceae bacterium]|nr:DNA starvation/stationary phase protection protein [Saprospiraceae bacterium]
MNYLGLNSEKVGVTVAELNTLLANYHIYYQNLRNFHWNVEGENFFDLHEKFEELYDDALIKIDEIAERVLTLRHRPISRFSDYIAEAEIDESPVFKEDSKMVAAILSNHRAIIKSMRRVIDVAGKAEDEGTIDLIGSALENIEKKSWMLDAWLAKKEEASLVQ